MKPHVPLLFEGCATALATPFRDGALDRLCFLQLLQRQLEAGVDALVVGGTTGEASTLTDAEKQWLFTATVQATREGGGRVPVIAGTGSNNTRRACELSRMAEACGCDGLLVVTPYYNKTSQQGLIAHYEAIEEAVSLPLLLYHVPGRTGCRLTPKVCQTLSRHPRVVGLKDATGDLSFASHVSSLCGASLPLYSGNDDLTLPLLAIGGRGVISVAANLCPHAIVKLCRLWQEGKTARAREFQLALLPLCHALFTEVNPIPLKAGMAALGLCTEEVRLPLVKAAPAVGKRVVKALRNLPPVP